MARKLTVEIVGDSKSYEKALGRSAKATNNFGTAIAATSPRVGKLQGTMAATGFSAVGLAGAAVGVAGVIGVKMVQAASDLNEEISKSAQIFGDSSKAIKDWSETTAKGMGISQTEALRATGTFGALFKTLSVGEQQNANLSKSLVQLAADMASFNNANPEDVLLALRSGLTGEAEPLRRFGVFLSEARTQQVALNQTGKESIKQLTNQEKVLARYSIIMKDTTSAQGDFSRTSGSLANQQRVLAAESSNLASTIGQSLIPAFQVATGAAIIFTGSLNDAVKGSKNLRAALEDTSAFDGFNSAVEGATSRVSGFFLSIRDGIPFLKDAKQAVQELAGAADDSFDVVGAEKFRAEPGGGGRRGVGLVEGQQREAADATKRNKDIAAAGDAVIASITRQAAAQDDFNVQLANSETRAAHLRDLIRADPDNAKIQKRLTAELVKQKGLRESIAAAAKADAQTAKDAAEAAKDAARAETERRRERAKTIAENKRKAVQAAQFQAIGLTAAGEKPTPGAEALLSRAQTLQEQVKGTIFDTPKTKTQLQKIVGFLEDHLKTAKKDTRAAILDLLNGISDAFKQGDKKITGPLTKAAGLNTNKFLEGLGLTPEAEREARARLSHLNTMGQRLRGSGSSATPGKFVNDQPIIVNTTVNLDGKKVATNTTRHQQKARQANPLQKRGPHRG